MSSRPLTISLGVALAPLVAVFFASQSACILNDDFLATEEVFPCETNADCSEGGFACDPSRKTCVLATSIVLCTDVDQDGYGVGEIREECEFSEEDPDDSNAAVNPGAEEVCDGFDNNGDGETDETQTCAGILDCPTRPAVSGAPWNCVDNVCVVTPPNAGGECAGVTIPCVNGVYDRTEAEAKGCITPN